MNILEFIQNGGKVRTASGQKVSIESYSSGDNSYPIIGFVFWPNNHKSKLEWNNDGQPKDLVTHKCLNLVPTIPITKHYSIPTSILKDYDNFEELISSQINVLNNNISI
nr:MAG: hypothetical protein [Caudoviricetes sp.]